VKLTPHTIFVFANFNPKELNEPTPHDEQSLKLSYKAHNSYWISDDGRVVEIPWQHHEAYLFEYPEVLGYTKEEGQLLKDSLIEGNANPEQFTLEHKEMLARGQELWKQVWDKWARVDIRVSQMAVQVGEIHPKWGRVIQKLLIPLQIKPGQMRLVIQNVYLKSVTMDAHDLMISGKIQHRRGPDF
jgi:hypothetical protein